LLDEHHFLNCRDQIELLDVFTEFSWFDLGVIEKVLNDKSKNVGRALLDLKTAFKLGHQKRVVCVKHNLTGGQWLRLEFLDEVVHLLVNKAFFDVLCNDRVEWVSHLMGHAGIYQLEHHAMSLLHVIKDRLGDINKLNHYF
jgi:hypothetical protein